MCKTYDVINQRIMELLEQNVIPWRKTWNAGGGGEPKNLISKKSYRGINLFMLACMPFGSSYWMTFKQCQERGGRIRKGEKSSPVIFWKWLDRKDEDATDGEASNGKIPMLKYYQVFNVEQTEGITAPPTSETVTPFSPIERAEQIIAGMPLRPEIKHGNRPSYSPTLDYVQICKPSAFDTPADYYDTLFHELGHSTGHVSRLGRKGVMETSYYGSHEYSKEELVAEMSACFLCGHAGIEQKTIENNAAYIQGFLKLLKGDKTALVHAAAAAQKASDFILNVTHQKNHAE